MSDKATTINQLKNKIKKFVKDRNWEQYHSPKNLSMSLAVEVAELMEMFQWLTVEESKTLHLNKAKRQKIEDELADIAVFLLNLCNVLNVDLSRAILKKLAKNNKKYPVRLAKGKAHKYTHYRRKRR